MSIEADAVIERVRECEAAVRQFQSYEDEFLGESTSQQQEWDFAHLVSKRLPKQLEQAAAYAEGKVPKKIYDGLHTIPAGLARCLPIFGSEIFGRWQNLMFRNGVSVANRGSFILAIAHLYKACRHHGPVNEWHDLDFVCATQEGSQPLVTKLNANADSHAMARHFYIAMGGSATAFTGALHKRPKLLSDKQIHDKSRMIIPKHTLVKSISDAYLRCVQRHGQSEREYILDTALKAIDQNAQGTTGTAFENGCVQYTPVSMLTTFKKHYIADEPTLNFDYFGFHEVCAKALRKMYLSFLDHCRSPAVANARHDAEFVESIL